MTVPEIIELLGDATAVAADLHLPPTTVSNWKARESIPARYHAAIVGISGGKVTAEMLMKAHIKVAAKAEAA